MRYITMIIVCYMLSGCSNELYADCPQPIIRRDGLVVTKEKLTNEQLHIVLRAKVRCGIIYPRSKCVKSVTFFTYKQHTEVICRGEEQ